MFEKVDTYETTKSARKYVEFVHLGKREVDWKTLLILIHGTPLTLAQHLVFVYQEPTQDTALFVGRGNVHRVAKKNASFKKRDMKQSFIRSVLQLVLDELSV